VSTNSQTNAATRSEENTKGYGVVRKDNGQWFGGFNADMSVRWVDERAARHLTKLEASAQAALLIRHSIPVQRKPAVLA
jgi:hypothetical protein